MVTKGNKQNGDIFCTSVTVLHRFSLSSRRKLHSFPLIEVLEVPYENGNRDITNKGRLGALSFDIERPATPFFCLARPPKCGRAKSCSFWGQKVPPERIFKPKTSVKWCIMRYIGIQCGRKRYFWGANCIGYRYATSVRQKSKKSKQKHLLGNTHTPSDKTKQENTLYGKVVTTFGGMSTLRNGAEWILTFRHTAPRHAANPLLAKVASREKFIVVSALCFCFSCCLLLL